MPALHRRDIEAIRTAQRRNRPYKILKGNYEEQSLFNPFMLAGAALRKMGESWEFASVATLEDFIWDKIYSIKGEVCEILALSNRLQYPSQNL
ncbi:hypothetical protein [Nodularia spumigena]|uniref:Uncharacterized protein n=1 Tax=Nodularia spumigena UHCC 0060 TaxID=3110300 RepID=A0ABU5UQ92_NODSP|nr:hypothetical protein [Nodularia spumigena]MEA5526729.1 hypothetical protein [Nodularia spumigena UHCC 0143]MEA5608432.1 hypothetical protein [Nodularia spumigena UHCC 0060]MEA5613049.1 hypothetical protein [Nodularia spumigena UHCC 0040]